jgi:exoribonuclease R
MSENSIKLQVNDAAYTQWSYVNTESKEEIPNTELPSPLANKWFHNDIIDFSNKENPQVVKSPIRTESYIPGVLILDGNRTYGRTKNGKRLLYKCIPDDKHLPYFMVPYEIKISFSKCYINKYVLFRFDEWTTQHPHGILVETLGDVNKLEVFYEYQLYLKSLNSSLKEMNDKINKMTKTKTLEEYFKEIQYNKNYKIRDTTIEPNPPQIFTIDPNNTVDFDDGLSIDVCPNTQDICVTVYITNVVFWLELFQLWNSFGNRIATIYLPDRRRPMLPTILSESLCSLKEGTKRFAVAYHFYIKNGVIDDERTVIENVLISPYKNYVYEENALIYQDKNYIQLIEATSGLDSHVKNSKEMVTYWMIKTNTHVAEYLFKNKTGIFRVSKYIRRTAGTVEEPEKSESEMNGYAKLTKEERQYLEYKVDAQSVSYSEGVELVHELLGKSLYVRSTSVLRRYEDVCNTCMLMGLMGMEVGEVMYKNVSREKERKVLRVESECKMMKRTMEGVSKVTGVVYGREKLLDGRYKYELYVSGEGTKSVKVREYKEKYKKYELRRYVDEKKGGMKLRMEFV